MNFYRVNVGFLSKSEGTVNLKPSISVLSACLLGMLCLVLGGCMTSDDARILQLLNERGFGRKYGGGNVNETFYFGIGDSFKYDDTFNPELKGTAKIRMDGTAHLPHIGDTYVAGLTAQEIASMLSARLGHYYKFTDITVTPGSITSKKVFIQLDTERHMVKKFQGDSTLFDVIQMVKYSSIDVDLDNVKVIRADPVHPLVIYCDMNAMIHNGLSRDNILIKEDDIIYFTPTLIGYFKNLVKTLLSPLQPVVQLVTGVQRLDYTFETFGNSQLAGRGRNRFMYY